MSQIDQIILAEAESESWKNYKPKNNSQPQKGIWVKSFFLKKEVDKDEILKIINHLKKIDSFYSSKEIRNIILQTYKIGVSQEIVDELYYLD